MTPEGGFPMTDAERTAQDVVQELLATGFLSPSSGVAEQIIAAALSKAEQPYREQLEMIAAEIIVLDARELNKSERVADIAIRMLQQGQTIEARLAQIQGIATLWRQASEGHPNEQLSEILLAHAEIVEIALAIAPAETPLCQFVISNGGRCLRTHIEMDLPADHHKFQAAGTE